MCHTICLKVEGDLEKGEERAETGEMKILELEEELRCADAMLIRNIM